MPSPLAGGLKKARDSRRLQVGLAIMQLPCSQCSIQKLKYRWEHVDKQKNFHSKSVTYVEGGF